MSTRTLFPGATRPKKKKRDLQEHELLMGIYLQELKLHYFREYLFHDRRAWRFDFAVPGCMLAIEMEGGIWTQGRHSRGKGFQEDLHKYQEAALLGWTVMRFSVEDVKCGRAKMVVAKWLQGRKAA
jgi:hypothetical protein